MKITEEQLNQLIQEEIDQAIEEGWMDRLRSRVAGGAAAVGSAGERIGQAAQHVATGKGIEDTDTGYSSGKVRRLIELKANKFLKMKQQIIKVGEKLGALNEDFLNDAKKMGISDDPTVVKASKQFIRISKYLQGKASKGGVPGVLDRALSGGVKGAIEPGGKASAAFDPKFADKQPERGDRMKQGAAGGSAERYKKFADAGVMAEAISAAVLQKLKEAT